MSVPQFQLPITPVIQEIDWGLVTRPAIRELVAQGQKDMHNLPSEDPNYTRYLRFSRVLVIKLGGQSIAELGLGRGFDGTDANDIYQITIKAPTVAAVMSIFNKLRDGLIQYPKIDSYEVYRPYNRFEIETTELLQEKAGWIANFQVIARRSGMVREQD